MSIEEYISSVDKLLSTIEGARAKLGVLQILKRSHEEEKYSINNNPKLKKLIIKYPDLFADIQQAHQNEFIKHVEERVAILDGKIEELKNKVESETMTETKKKNFR